MLPKGKKDEWLYTKRMSIKSSMKMMSLSFITVRFKSNRTDITRLYINILQDQSYSSPSKVSIPIKRVFYTNTINYAVSVPIDTTIQVNAYAKAGFSISSSVTIKAQPSSIGRILILKDYAKRDEVFLFEF
jgi:hypothetical protein